MFKAIKEAKNNPHLFMKQTPWVNFTNILRKIFMYVSCKRSFLCLRFRFVLYKRKTVGAKAVRRTLMKLNPCYVTFLCLKNHEGKREQIMEELINFSIVFWRFTLFSFQDQNRLQTRILLKNWWTNVKWQTLLHSFTDFDLGSEMITSESILITF